MIGKSSFSLQPIESHDNKTETESDESQLNSAKLVGNAIPYLKFQKHISEARP